MGWGRVGRGDWIVSMLKNLHRWFTGRWKLRPSALSHFVKLLLFSTILSLLCVTFIVLFGKRVRTLNSMWALRKLLPKNKTFNVSLSTFWGWLVIQQSHTEGKWLTKLTGEVFIKIITLLPTWMTTCNFLLCSPYCNLLHLIHEEEHYIFLWSL